MQQTNGIHIVVYFMTYFLGPMSAILSELLFVMADIFTPAKCDESFSVMFTERLAVVVLVIGHYNTVFSCLCSYNQLQIML